MKKAFELIGMILVIGVFLLFSLWIATEGFNTIPKD